MFTTIDYCRVKATIMLKPLLEKLNGMRVILASSSKQRKDILGSMGLKFEVIPSKFEENLCTDNYSTSEFVEQTALGKAKDVYEQLKEDNPKPDIIIGVDTMVAFDGKIYGKPKSREEAISTITRLTRSNIPNMVYTGVVILYKKEVFKFTEVTMVYMDRLTDEEILAYVDSGEPFGKAGGFGIQGVASTFIKRIDGDFNNVIGLPLWKLTKELKRILGV